MGRRKNKKPARATPPRPANLSASAVVPREEGFANVVHLESGRHPDARPPVPVPAVPAPLNAFPSRRWFETTLQVLSVILVPLTVAGAGWYWTRWQQGVNDIKSMIDLVTDKSPEKQKYGIAMFEYLAKNGKVPVEFLAAQIDFATTAENAELLPMLEAAIINAAKENPEVADAYSQALARRPSRVFIHVPNDLTYRCLVTLRESFKDVDKAKIRFPAVRKYEGYANSNQELRYFHMGDKERAEQISRLFGTLGLDLPVKDLSGTQWSANLAPNSYELWFSGKVIPQLCQPSTG